MENTYFYYLELKNLQFNGKVKCKILLINHCEKFNVQLKAGLLNANFRIMMFWSTCFFLNLVFSSDGFEINVLHKPQVHKSFGEGSYMFNQPVYEHGYEGIILRPWGGTPLLSSPTPLFRWPRKPGSRLLSELRRRQPRLGSVRRRAGPPVSV